MKVMSIRSLDCGVHLSHICTQVGDIVTVVPGTTERERRIEERGTTFWM
jgi:hypothetical protein